MHWVAVRVAGQREDIGKRALAAALVADDGDHVGAQRQLAAQTTCPPCRRQRSCGCEAGR